MTNLKRIANAICDATYGDLMEMADTLCNMHDDSPRDLSNREAWAEMLHAWAETNFSGESDDADE